MSTKIKTLLLYPPGHDTLKYDEIYFPPLGIGSVAAFLQKNKMQTEIYYKQQYDLIELNSIIYKNKPEIIGISCDSNNRYNCFKIAKFIKSIDKKIFVVLGGIHATIFHKQIIKRLPYIDFIIRGEGEYALFELISAMESKSFSNVKGLTFRYKSKITINPGRPSSQNMNHIPFFNYGIKNIDNENTVLSKSSFIYQTMRGCPFNCNFCASFGMWKQTIICKDIGRVVSDLLIISEKYKIKKVVFADCTFNCQPLRLERLCEEIILNKIKIKWYCFARISCASKRSLELMKMAGCEGIFYGVESFSDKMLKKMNKGNTSDEAVKVLNLTNKIGIKAAFSIILGFPGETKQTLKESFSVFKRLNRGVSCDNVGMYEPYPSSNIYKDLEQRGLINDDIWFTNFKMLNFIKTLYDNNFVSLIENFCEEIEKFSGRYTPPQYEIVR